MKKKWRIQTPDSQSVRQLCEALKCHPITASVLCNRNLADVSAAHAFINTSIKDLRPPFAVKDMGRAVKRIHTALVQKEKILIFGDYDVDGITATVLFFEFLKAAGARVDYYVPHRVTEGYGLRESHIRDHVEPNRYDLLITVDCGIASHEAVCAANKAHIDVIITDHHQVPETLPEALAVINPKRADCNAGFAPLAGVGVVYLVLICLRKYLRDQGFWAGNTEPNLKTACDLVALGTVADIVPLILENRILTQIGIDALNSGQRPGIMALLEAAGVNGPLAGGEDISFRLAPRINAAGRIGHANSAIELLMTRDADKAAHLADTLNKLNTERRSIENAMLKQILERLMTYPDLNRKPALILSDPNWHEGVLGIVAAKLVDRYYRPVILISTRNGAGKGSARSIPGFNLHDGLLKAAGCLESFGGHAAAAGLSIKKENIARFTSQFENIVKENTRPEAFIPVVTIDQEITFDQISPLLADELERLQPFGEGNPEPLFSARNIRIAYSQMMGGVHRRMRLTQPGTQSSQALHAIQFNVAPAPSASEHLDQIAFRLRWNRWNGKKTLQLLIEETQ
ncbi:MAG: single-stranded-DNA-specific exonuclease RecJ [Pseudomonadota bacterium]